MYSSRNAGKKSRALGNKRHVRIFYPDEIHLSLSELVVFSYRAYQDEYAEQAPHRKQVAKAVGLSYNTVGRADDELMRQGLLDCNLKAHPPAQNAFRRKRKPEEGKHWRHDLLSWSMYVRSRTGDISLLETAVWSYAVHCAETGWHGRIGVSYLSAVLRANRQALQKVLGELKKSGLLVEHNGNWRPVACDDWSWLAERWNGSTGAGFVTEWAELPDGRMPVVPRRGPKIETAPRPSPHDCLVALVKPIKCDKTPHIPRGGRTTIVNAIQALPEWQHDYYAAYLELAALVGKCLPGTGWDVLAARADLQIATPDLQIATPDLQIATPRSPSGDRIRLVGSGQGSEGIMSSVLLGVARAGSNGEPKPHNPKEASAGEKPA